MFTYVCVGTNDLARAVAFYDAVMAALGQQRCDAASEPDGDATSSRRCVAASLRRLTLRIDLDDQ